MSKTHIFLKSGALLVVMALCSGQVQAVNYLQNGDMEYHWGHTPVLNLQYIGPGSDCRIKVDLVNQRLQTIVDGDIDLDYDLADRTNIEEQFQLKALIEDSSEYTVAYPGWNGLNRGGESWSPTADYCDVWNGMHNLKTEVGQIPEGLPGSWGSYGASTSGSCMFAHSGKFSLHVYDNRPSGVPGSGVAGSPESVNYYQELADPNEWGELLGKDVVLSGWVYMPSDSYQNDGTPGYLVRIEHGPTGDKINTDFGANPLLDQWNYFEYAFTVDAATDSMRVILFSGGSAINEVYNGHGSAYFDDLVLDLPAGNPADINGDGVVDINDLVIMAGSWLEGTGGG